MENWIRIWMLLLEVSAFAYMLVMLIISAGWYFTKVFIPKSNSASLKVSVVIAVRNESAGIKSLLVSLLKQTYPKNLFEVIIVDDNSDDQTVEIINQFKTENPELILSVVKSKGQGKKDALKRGFEQVNSEIIITTDGDCQVEPNWIKNYVSYFENNDAQLLFGPVFYSNSNSFQKYIFTLEFATLVASGAGSVGIGLPLMGNGANLAFRKSAFEKVKEKLSGAKFASGDDVFLMHAISSNYGNAAVKFIKNKSSIVETSAPENLGKFVNQRIRWGSKAKAYKSIWALAVAMVVFVFNVLLGLTAFLAFYKIWFLAVLPLFVILKFLIDFPLIRNFLKFYNRLVSAIFLFPLEFFYPFYIMLTALFSIFIPYRWKGRTLIK